MSNKSVLQYFITKELSPTPVTWHCPANNSPLMSLFAPLSEPLSLSAINTRWDDWNGFSWLKWKIILSPVMVTAKLMKRANHKEPRPANCRWWMAGLLPACLPAKRQKMRSNDDDAPLEHTEHTLCLMIMVCWLRGQHSTAFLTKWGSGYMIWSTCLSDGCGWVASRVSFSVSK